MGYENDPYRDEDGEPLMDPDMPFDGEQDDLEEDWSRERSPTPVHDYDSGKAKPRKRLIKKSTKDDFDAGEDVMDFVRDDSDNETYSNKRKGSKEGGSGKTDKKQKSDRRPEKGVSKFSSKAGGSGSSKDHGADPEMKEMWDTIAGGDSEGGYVDYCHGGWRLQGSLAVSRGIGDQHLKQWVIADPDTQIFTLKSDDEFLILASDGLWDKVSNQEAVDITRPLCFETNEQPLLSACKKLADLAVVRGSVDDISVMLIKLGNFI